MARSVAQAEAWGRAHPTRDGGSWKNWCASLMFRAGDFGWSADTATKARQASTIQSSDASLAPAGSFHWWDIRGITEGHVGLDLDGAGHRVMMATDKLDTSWGSAIGTTSVTSYGTRSASMYRGWSRDFVRQTLSAIDPVSASANGLTIQQLAQRHGYTGPIDGSPGRNTWSAVQRALRPYGYRGPIDGVPGPATYRALQMLAREGGYSGPTDGVLGPNTFVALARIVAS
jgi:hypothetical protein